MNIISSKKLIVIFATLFFTCILVLIFYFLFFYLPLLSNKELFPPVEDREMLYLKEKISEELKEKHGIGYDRLNEIIRGGENIYFIDGREIEEYEVFRVKNAAHLRATDILEADDMAKALNITLDELKGSLVIVYCHDGTRAAEVVVRLNQSNIKFLIDGRMGLLKIDPLLVEGSIAKSPFPSHIQNRDLTVSLEDARVLIEGGAFLIDGRLYDNDNLFLSAFDFRIGQLSTKEYNKKIENILEFKENNILFIANIYPDLFYAKLLVYRLERDYGFDFQKFHVIFGQDTEFAKVIRKYE